MEIVTIATPSLGDRTYLLIDGESAAVIDPQRDIDRIESILLKRHLRLTHVFESHVHNDYVTGGLELCRKHRCTYVLSDADTVAFEHTGAQPGDTFAVGKLVVTAIATPGHTPTHLSYAVSRDGETSAVFTGGSMLFGTVGRTDLISDAATETLTRQQFQSVRRLADDLPADAIVYPTHGFGSFCSSTTSSGADASTIGDERRKNVAFTVADEDAFVAELLGGFAAYPRYYAYMAPINRSGPSPVDLSSPATLDPVEIRQRIHAGEWVVDLRARTAFARGHLAGTINLAVGASFATYLGWTIPWGTPVTLVGDSVEEVAEAQRQMVRIGIDRPAGSAIGGLDEWAVGGEIRSYETATFADLMARQSRDDGQEGMVVLDVRRDDERAAGFLANSVHIPLQDLAARVDQFTNKFANQTVWVHCASGYRASLAASLLDRAGCQVVAIDDDWSAALANGTIASTQPDHQT
jgi:hydroxyacylglutathione hydrolase